MWVYISGFRPSTVLHSGHRWTTSLHDFMKNGKKQQPKKPPTKKTTQHMNHVEPPIRYSLLVTTCCPHDEHTTSCEWRWKNEFVLNEALLGWVTTGEGADGCPIRIEKDYIEKPKGKWKIEGYLPTWYTAWLSAAGHGGGGGGGGSGCGFSLCCSSCMLFTLACWSLWMTLNYFIDSKLVSYL